MGAVEIWMQIGTRMCFGRFGGVRVGRDEAVGFSETNSANLRLNLDAMI